MSYDILDVRRLLEAALDGFSEHHLDSDTFDDLPSPQKRSLLNRVIAAAKELRDECQ